MDLKRNFSLILAPIFLLVSFWITAPFYPVWMAAGGSILAVLLPLALRGNALPGLLVLGAFFGNHPGGRGLEFFDLALLSALVYRLPGLRVRFQGRVGYRYRGLIVLLLLSTAFSYLGAYYLLESFEGYKLLPFHFLSARDWLPHYSLKVAAANVLCATLVIDWALEAREENKATQTGAFIILLAFLFPAFIGILELWPPVAQSLDRYHVWLDGYVDRTPPHRLSFFPALVDWSPNSLFWNRSWFALYLISSIPATGIALHFFRNRIRLLHGTLRIALFLLLLTVSGFLFLSIGARAGILSFLVFLAVIVPLLVLEKSRRILAWTMVAGVALLLFSVPLLAYWPSLETVLAERAELYRSGIQVFLQSPIFGTGVESFGFYNDLILRGAGYQRVYSSTHNFLLQLGGGMGLAGVILIAVFLFLAFRCSIQSMGQKPAVASFPPIVYFAGAMALLVYGNFQELWYLRGIQLNWWFMVFGSIIWLEPEQPRTASVHQPSPREIALRSSCSLLSSRRATMIVGCALLFLFSAFSIYRGVTLPDRWPLFENVGHLQRIPDSDDSGYALLQGDGSFIRQENGKLVREMFECEESDPPLSGPPDPRRICRYESVDLKNAAQEIPPGL